MKLPSGQEVSKETLVEMCEAVISAKMGMECTFAEAFEETADTLSEGNWSDVPTLDEEDISFLYGTLKDVVIDCEAALRSALGTFMAENETVKSW